MRFNKFQTLLVLLIGVLVGYFISSQMKKEGFEDKKIEGTPICSNCGDKYPCASCDPSQCRAICPQCPPLPDMTKYVLKSSIPPCPTCPDMNNYMLKTECPPVPDLAQYVLKSSIPKPEPIIIDNSACRKNGGPCPPCPRPRCPEVKCPPPTVCPACPPCPRPKCPEKVVKCKAEYTNNSPVRPYLTPLSVSGFGGGGA